MGIYEQFQTIVYDPVSGGIVKVLPNQYIKSRKKLEQLVAPRPTRRHFFFYLHTPTPVDPASFSVRIGVAGKPPTLVTPDGMDATLSLFSKEALFNLSRYKAILFKFEGGMGDYLDQADTVVAVQKEYPHIKMSALIDFTRSRALRLLEGFEEVKILTSKEYIRGRSATIDFARITRVSAHYPVGGKVGVYSLIAGLDHPAVRAKFCLSPASLEEADLIIDKACGRAHGKLIALHTMSGNTNTKSIKPANALKIITPLLKNQDLIFLHLGGAGEEAIDHPQVISLQGKLPWEKVVAVMACCDGCVCIDSAIMHIAQHLGIPTVSLWGPTTPQHILAEDPGVETVVTTAPCAGCDQYNCDHCDCMTRFDKKDLNRKLRKLGGTKNAEILPNDGD